MTQAADTYAPPPPMSGAALMITAVALATGTFMQMLDATICNVAIPTISGNLGVSTSQGAWMITAFAIANGVSVPLTGWLMGRYGVVTTFVASVSLFTLASFLCGISWNLPSLIVFRILQGAVSGPMVPGSQALMIMIFPPNRRGTALAIWSMTTLVSPILGPVMGGYISDNFAWPWVFLVNVPVGIVCAVLCWRNMHSRETPTRQLPIDRVGFMLLAVWVGASQILLDTGRDADWFHSPAIWLETAVGVIAFVAWLIWELNEEHPIVDLSLLRSPSFVLPTIPFALVYAVFFGITVMQPTWLQTQMGYIATWAGLVSTPAGLLAVVLTPLVARLTNGIDARITATFSLVAFGISFLMRSFYTPQADFIHLSAPMMLQGFATATFFVPLVSLTLNGIPPAQIPAASGLSNFIRLTVASFSASLVINAYEKGAIVHQTQIAESIGAGNPVFQAAMRTLQGAGMSGQQALGTIVRQVTNQAYTLAALDIFRICGTIVLLAIPFVWFTRKVVANGPPPAVD